jgi:hypothetical protein
MSYNPNTDKEAEWVRLWCDSYGVRHQNHIALPAQITPILPCRENVRAVYLLK